MKHYSAKPIRLDLRPSRLLGTILVVAATLACAAVAVLPLPAVARLAVMALILAAAAFHVLRDAQLRLRSSLLALEVGSDGVLRYLTPARGWCEATVRGESFVMSGLAVLVLKPEGRYFLRYAILLSDSADTEMFRRLRVWLRWGSQALAAEN